MGEWYIIVVCREIRRFQELLQDESVSMDCLILPDKAEIPDGLDKSTASIVRVSSTVMRKLSGLQTTDSLDAIALMKIPASFFNVDDDQKNYQKVFSSVHRILVLDGIQVIHNVTSWLYHFGSLNVCLIIFLVCGWWYHCPGSTYFCQYCHWFYVVIFCTSD